MIEIGIEIDFGNIENCGFQRLRRLAKKRGI